MIHPVLKRLTVVAAVAAVLAAIVILRVPVCPSAALFRLPCPGCGMTRALSAMLRGDLAQAYHLHPVAPLAIPVLAGCAIGHVVAYVWPSSGRLSKLLASKWVEWLVLGIVALMIAVWIARFFGGFGGPAKV